MNQIQDDEIDLFELFQTLWDGKWLISAFTFIAMLIGAWYLNILNKEVQYESKLTYVVDNVPPFYRASTVFFDFKNNFYSKRNFENWKKTYGKTSFVYEDFSITEVINGFVFTKPEGQQLATISSSSSEGNEYFILIKTNNLSTLDGFFKYAQFINQLLNKEYVERAKTELKIMKLRFKDLSSVDSKIVQNVLSIDRFVMTAEKGADILTIQHPSIPNKVSSKLKSIFFIFILSGAILGVLYVFISKAISNRKERQLKA
tara:strand:- start:828 stop:1604 length:777 start_codon:yes stop_codon:yes gene_type:complete